MKSIIQFFFYVFVGVISLNSQNAKISGKVIDDLKTTLPYATVILKDSEDKLIEGLVTDEEGKFSFSKIKKGVYILKVEYIGFEDFLKKIVVNAPKQKIKIETIILNEDSKKVR